MATPDQFRQPVVLNSDGSQIFAVDTSVANAIGRKFYVADLGQDNLFRPVRPTDDYRNPAPASEYEIKD